MVPGQVIWQSCPFFGGYFNTLMLLDELSTRWTCFLAIDKFILLAYISDACTALVRLSGRSEFCHVSCRPVVMAHDIIDAPYLFHRPVLLGYVYTHTCICTGIKVLLYSRVCSATYCRQVIDGNSPSTSTSRIGARAHIASHLHTTPRLQKSKALHSTS